MVIGLLVGGAAALLTRGEGDGSAAARRLGDEDRSFASVDPLTRGCGLAPDLVTRLWRGSDGVHDQDILFVPNEPNYVGAFDYTSHTGPWDYVAEVPLVVHGPHVPAAGDVSRPVTLADIYSTIGRLTGVDLDDRDGRPLTETLDGGDEPRLILSVMWDGVGNNVLKRWPESWPVLRGLMETGVSYTNATVGSSPSITPSTHSTFATGYFPREHGVTAIKYRADDGTVREAFDDLRPQDLAATTFADDVDDAFEGRSEVGLVAWQTWHLGMLGSGAALAGADKDHVGLITGNTSGALTETNPDFYTTPWKDVDPSRLAARIDEVDRSDGASDGKWEGQEIAEHKNNPAWVEWETDLLIQMMDENGFGTDEVPDLVLTNYKATDIIGHQLSMDSRQMGDDLAAQDAALGRLVEYLDRTVQDYAVIVTADHGNTPRASRSGAWPIASGELTRDIDSHFGTPAVDSLVETMPAHGIFLDQEVAEGLDLSEDALATFLNGYTIQDNWSKGELPPGYRDRGDEPVFAAAFPTSMLDDIARCRFEGSLPE